MGGETAGTLDGGLAGSGLSPRGRGNPVFAAAAIEAYRSIPAWAGKPCCPLQARAPLRVYPRVGGETWRAEGVSNGEWGLSPRGRGNRILVTEELLFEGSIPAWAGKPRGRCRQRSQAAVYPRVGGETMSPDAHTSPRIGLSPRGGRGNRCEKVRLLLCHGSIPAWAGKPPLQCRHHLPRRVYPRVGGETCAYPETRRRTPGLSPRGRGNRSVRVFDERLPGSIPRVGGETEQHEDCNCAVLGLSPRGRGNRTAAIRHCGFSGSIPAWAGKPRTMRPLPARPRVYPRVGGETGWQAYAGALVEGLSPRGRGNRAGHVPRHRARGSIPAWAGKPAAYEGANP